MRGQADIVAKYYVEGEGAILNKCVQKTNDHKTNLLTLSIIASTTFPPLTTINLAIFFSPNFHLVLSAVNLLLRCFRLHEIRDLFPFKLHSFCRLVYCNCIILLLHQNLAATFAYFIAYIHAIYLFVFKSQVFFHYLFFFNHFLRSEIIMY